MSVFFKGNCLGLQKLLPLTEFLLVSAARGFGDLSSWHWAGGPGVGLGLLTPKISLPNFYLLHVDVGPDHSSSPPLLPVWIDVISLIP